jgi:hypothetical protein
VAGGCSERYRTEYTTASGSGKHTVLKVPRKCPVVLLVKIKYSKRKEKK